MKELRWFKENGVDQIEFIEAFDYLTSEGYRLMANESYPSKWSGRNITYFYFQKI